MDRPSRVVGSSSSHRRLAVFVDFRAGALPVTMHASSLDDTLRLRCPGPARGCLLDTRVSGLASGCFHDGMSIFSRHGVLLAAASQTGILPRKSA